MMLTVVECGSLSEVSRSLGQPIARRQGNIALHIGDLPYGGLIGPPGAV